jgi:hypothetical protein
MDKMTVKCSSTAVSNNILLLLAYFNYHFTNLDYHLIQITLHFHLIQISKVLL